jgi:hypothetical protein
LSERIAAKVKKTRASGEANSEAEFAFGTLEEELALAVLDALEPVAVSMLAMILGQFWRTTYWSCRRCCQWR